MYRVLLIGPERNGLAPCEQAALLRILNDSGFTAASAPLGGIADGIDALCYAFSGRPPHLLIVDLTAPASLAAGTLPLRHIQRIQREAWGEDTDLLPVIALLTQRHLGANDLPAYINDFLLPPHAPDELVARIRLFQFRRQHTEEAGILRFHGIYIDVAAGCAFTAGGTRIPLAPREYHLLHFLLIHRGKLFSRERLLDLVWGREYEGGARTVDIHVRRLRAKLPAETGARLENRRGVGYGLISAPQ